MTVMRLTSSVTLLLIWLLQCFPNTALADQISVRSGEHKGFTRLVLDLPGPRSWQLKTEGTRAQIKIEGAKSNFDLTRAFRKIGTDRVSDLQPNPDENALDISLNCECGVEAFTVGNRMLVIDIKEPTETNKQKRLAFNASVGSGLAGNILPPYADLSARTFAAQTGVNRPVLAFNPTSKKINIPLTLRRLPERVPPSDITASIAKLPSLRSDIERSKRISEAEKRLAKQLGRAASQGLLKARTEKPKALIKAPLSSSPKKQSATDPRKTPKSTKLKVPGVNLRAVTSADRDFLQALNELPLNANGSQCLADEALNVPAWASKEPFTHQLGTLRSGLVREFDRPDAEQAMALAKFYIHFGFGAEALYVLKLSNLTDQNAQLLSTLAEIVEYGNALTPTPFSNQFNCDTAAALWAILAIETLPSSVELNEQAVLRSLSAFPAHLRRQLGPIISARLSKSGRGNLASKVLRVVERGVKVPDASFKMARAEQKLTDGKFKSASQDLNQVITSNTELSPKALLKLINSNLEADLTVELNIAKLAGAYAKEYRKQPIGAELRRAHILALAKAKAFDEAFRELNAYAHDGNPQNVEQIRHEAIVVLSKLGTDTEFLTYATANPPTTVQFLGAGKSVLIASRFIELGFPAQGLRLLHSNESEPRSERNRILAAKALLLLRKPRQAEATILGLSGNGADQIRAKARSLSGDHQAAQKLYEAIDQNAAMLEQAWLAGDWPTLRDSEDKTLVEIAELASPEKTKANSSFAEHAVLARNRALVSESEAVRRTLDDLLSKYPIPNAKTAEK